MKNKCFLYNADSYSFFEKLKDDGIIVNHIITDPPYNISKSNNFGKDFLMEKLKEFWNNYKGAIIGVIVAILILATKIYNLIVAIILIVIGALAGNYVQQNKQYVKDKIKQFIDRM